MIGRQKPTVEKLRDRARQDAEAAKDAVETTEGEILQRFHDAYARIEQHKGAADKAADEAKRASAELAIGHYNDAKKQLGDAAAVDLAPRAGRPNPVQELANVRTLAKEWLAAALALFGLFSFTALFFGSDALESLPDDWVVYLFLGAAVVALVAAVLCNFYGTRAAHGWPHTPRGKARLEENADAAYKLERAIGDLKVAVGAAAVTVAGIVVALGAVVWAQIVEDPPTLLQVELNNGANGPCGALVEASDTGIIIRQDDSKPAQDLLTPWADVRTVDAVRNC